MIVTGVDAHKRTHTLVALDAVTGTIQSEATVQASDDGALNALRCAAGLDGERVWAVEDCRHVSARLERALLGAGERVVRVPPSLTGESRKATRTPGKSDPIDARAVALAAIREGVERLPVAFLDEQAHEDPGALRLPRSADGRARPADQPPALASSPDRTPSPRSVSVRLELVALAPQLVDLAVEQHQLAPRLGGGSAVLVEVALHLPGLHAGSLLLGRELGAS
jgi:hypothetical protein